MAAQMSGLSGLSQRYATALFELADERKELDQIANDLVGLRAAIQESPDLQRLLDEELSRLPEKYQTPVVLCELQGLSRKDVARQLGMPEGTLSSRLATARRLLAERLTRRGLAVTAGSLVAAFSGNAAWASVPAPLLLSTTNAAGLLAAGSTGVGLIPAGVASLADFALKAMYLAKLKIVAALVIGVRVVGGAFMGRSGTETAVVPTVASSSIADRPVIVVETPRVPDSTEHRVPAEAIPEVPQSPPGS